MKKYKALKAAEKISVNKQKVVDRAAVSEVLDEDGNVSVAAQAEQSHEDLQVVKKMYDSDTGEAIDDVVTIYTLLDVEREVNRCKEKIVRCQEQHDD